MIELSVSDVRAALLGAARGSERGAGEASTLLLGRLFHEVFAELVGIHPERSGLRVLLEAGPDLARRTGALHEHAWRVLFAPRISRHAAELQGATEPVHMAWRALTELSAWLAAVVVELSERAAAGPASWEQIAGLLRAEVPLECELREPGWGESVRLTGVADSILRVPGRKALCAIEIKLGRAAPAIDLGQAALYRLIAARSGAGEASSALALLRFTPELDEQVIEAPALVPAEARLLELIASLAGVPRVPPGQPPLPSDPPRARVIESDRPEPSPHAEIGRRLVRACREHGVGIELRREAIVGPRFLRFEARLSPGARVLALKKHMPEVALRLSLAQEPIVTAEAGALFIDVARPDPEVVPFERVAPQLPVIDPRVGSARVPVGVDPGGRLKLVDLASAGRSHMLVAGTSGSGKSEWLRTAVAGLLASNTPDTLRLVTIDPKLAAFAELERSRFLWRPGAFWIPGGERDVTDLFDDLVEEMERRYGLTRASGTDDLAEHVRKTGQKIPRIVCFCDEYMALVATDREVKRRIEQSVTLLGAKARAAGIHLVLATQQPSRNVVSGAIQANLACRVALTLTSHIESNMILQTSGAERLTGSGDLLYRDFGDPQRLQAPLLSADERRRLFSG